MTSPMSLKEIGYPCFPPPPLGSRRRVVLHSPRCLALNVTKKRFDPLDEI